MIISEIDHDRFSSVLRQIGLEANARLVFLLDKAGQQIAAAGDLAEIDSTALASLAAGNVAATEGVAQLVGEQQFTSQFHEGVRESLHISVVDNRVILLVVFDERSSLGLVRLRVGQHAGKLGDILRDVLARDEAPASRADAFSEITEDDIDALFGG
jgi:predicted regulator of Ras-like GTPase activity (Roadblock/LC7/MglB family)